MSKTFITKTKNGIDVYVDTEHSHAATHLRDCPGLLKCIEEVLSSYEAGVEKSVRFETDLGREIGKTDLVETKDDDDIFYAKRLNRDKYTRFVRGREARPTSFVTIGLERKNDSEIEVHTAFFGKITPSFPSGKDDTNENNRAFWNKHARVVGNQEFLPETVTTECPW